MNVHYRIATPADDAALRRLMQATPLPGWVTLSFEREPDFFAAEAVDDAEHVSVVAEIDGKLAGFFSRSVRQVYIRGKLCRLGYLGELRVHPGYRNRLELLRGGYRYWREQLRSESELDWDITAILADNRVARRLLEKGGIGLPPYLPVSPLVTLAFSTTAFSNPAAVYIAENTDLERYCRFINAVNCERDLAPHARAENLRAALNSGGTMLGIEESGKIVACVMLWDRRSFRQEVVRSYATPVRILRPLMNLLLPIVRLPKLPPEGSTLATACLAWLAIEPGREEELLLRILSAAASHARATGLQTLIACWPEGAPELALIRKRIRALEYRSILYRVLTQQPDIDRVDFAQALHVEAAFL